MKRIVIAYHVYLAGSYYMELINDQFRKLIWSQLYRNSSKFYIGVVVGSFKRPENGVEWISNYFRFDKGKDPNRSMPDHIEIVIYDDNQEETKTLKWIRDYAKNNHGDYVLYFHTKGVVKHSKPIEDWRNYMEYFAIDYWIDCIEKLKEGYDCCGVMWNTDTPIGIHPHFSGNFWWATTDYINKLDHSLLDSPWRYDREFWIGSNPDVKPFEFHNSGLNEKNSLIQGKGHFDVEYPRINYEKK
jgi:hypothetical protein